MSHGEMISSLVHARPSPPSHQIAYFVVGNFHALTTDLACGKHSPFTGIDSEEELRAHLQSLTAEVLTLGYFTLLKSTTGSFLPVEKNHFLIEMLVNTTFLKGYYKYY